MTAVTQDTCNIILVEDHPLLWEGIVLLLEQDPRLKVTLRARDGMELFRSASLQHCDILILDISMPHMDGFHVIEKLNADFPEIDIIVLTMHTNQEFFSRCMGLGVKGYVLKRDPPHTLLNAVKNVLGGKIGISPSISPTLPETDDAEPEFDEILNKLTAREREVLSLVAGGLKSRDIAHTLGVKKSTVDKHREHIRATGPTTMEP